MATADAELEAIERAAVLMARAAGERALAAYHASLALEFKGTRRDDPVTAADRDIETFLRSALRQAFPAHGLLGEEHADEIAANARYVWALDPLDGTANFASRLPLWGVSLGLLRDGVPVVGCVWVPVGPGLAPGVFHARRGGGAWWDGERRLAVAEGEDLRGRLIALPGAYWRRFGFRRPPRGTPRTQRSGVDPRSLGSITAEATLVACGVLRLAVFVQPKIWDVVAGALLVQEAGGRALTWRGRSWEPLAHYEPTPPEKGGPPALRNWSRPVLLGTPAMAERVAGSLVWRPRLPKVLRRVIGG